MKSQDKIHKLKQVIELLQNDTITPKEVEQFLTMVVKVIKDQKDQFQSISNKNLAEIDTAVKYLSNQYKEQLAEIEKKATQDFGSKVKDVNKEVKKVESKIAEVQKLVKEAIEMKPKDGEDGKDYVLTDEDKKKIKEDIESKLEVDFSSQLKEAKDGIEEFDGKLKNLGNKFNEFSSRKIPVGVEIFKDGKNLGRFPSLNFKGGTVEASASRVDVTLGGGGAGGDVSKVGTPVDNQVAVWTGDGTIEGDSNFTWDGTTLSLGGTAGLDVNPGSDVDADLISVGVTGSPVLKWNEALSSFMAENANVIAGAGLIGAMNGANSGFMQVDGSGDLTISTSAGSVLVNDDFGVTGSSTVAALTANGAATFSSTADFDGATTLTSSVTIETVNGIDINPGSDTDVDIISIGVTGSPKIGWNESQSIFTTTNAGFAVDGSIIAANGANISSIQTDGSGNLSLTSFAGSILLNNDTDITGQLSVTDTATQLSLINNGAVKTDLFTNSSGEFDISPSGESVSINSSGSVLGYALEVWQKTNDRGLILRTEGDANEGAFNISADNVASNIPVWNITTGANEYIQFAPESTDTLRMEEGRVYIGGSSTPSTKLHVYGAISDQLRLENSTSGLTNIYTDTNGSLIMEPSGNKFGFNQTNPASFAHFTAGSPKIRIENSLTTQFSNTGFILENDTADGYQEWHFVAQKDASGSGTGDSQFYIRLRNAAQTEAFTPIQIDGDTGDINLLRSFSTGTVLDYGSVRIGGSATDRAKLTVADGTIPQLSLMHDASNLVDIESDSSGNLLISPSGSEVDIDGNLDVEGSGSFRDDITLIEEGTFATITSASYSDTNFHGSRIGFTRYRGTEASPTVVSSGDYAGWFDFFGYDGSATQRVAQFISRVDGTVSSGVVPGRFSISTSDSSGNSQLRLDLRSNDNMYTTMDGGNLGAGVSAGGTISAKIHAIDTGTQLRLGYDINNYTDLATDSSGDLLVTPLGGITKFQTDEGYLQINGRATGNVDLTSDGSINIVSGAGSDIVFRSAGTEGLRLQEDQQLTLATYGSGTNTGTLTYSLGVDSSGNVIETTPGDRKVTTVNAATYDVLTTDSILNVTYTTTAAVTSLTLPSAQAVSGRVVTIKDAGGNAGTNNITIDTEGPETIDGSATWTINGNYDWLEIYSDGSNWFIIG